VSDGNTLPKPIKRRSFTPRQRAMVAEAQAYGCANCGCSLTVNAFQIDHIQRLDALGKHEPSNWQALCVPCHAEKTRVDNREAKKGARLRLEKGQQQRRSPPTRECQSAAASWLRLLCEVLVDDEPADHAENDGGEFADTRDARSTEHGVDCDAAEHGNGENADVQKWSEAVLLFVREEGHRRSLPCSGLQKRCEVAILFGEGSVGALDLRLTTRLLEEHHG